ncbi:hypothetical protein Peur_048585 [Populus x canadensis]|uniref:Uncharacterized protein n=1 Tax=Populus deltoides TaxID=3696 RepID=A0A8T2ZIP3_POPDE|nr:hypothetical protein H0E87_005369 [Populus deltoides]
MTKRVGVVAVFGCHWRMVEGERRPGSACDREEAETAGERGESESEADQRKRGSEGKLVLMREMEGLGFGFVWERRPEEEGVRSAFVNREREACSLPWFSLIFC